MKFLTTYKDKNFLQIICYNYKFKILRNVLFRIILRGKSKMRMIARVGYNGYTARSLR